MKQVVTFETLPAIVGEEIKRGKLPMRGFADRMESCYDSVRGAVHGNGYALRSSNLVRAMEIFGWHLEINGALFNPDKAFAEIRRQSHLQEMEDIDMLHRGILTIGVYYQWGGRDMRIKTWFDAFKMLGLEVELCRP